MRIMATSDLHGNLDGLDPTGADVVVFAGDLYRLMGATVAKAFSCGKELM